MIEKLVSQKKQQINIQELHATYTRTMWRLWQLKLIAELDKEPDNRKIIWYVDERENSGKTYLTKYLVTQGDTVRLENGKSADINPAANNAWLVSFRSGWDQQQFAMQASVKLLFKGLNNTSKYKPQTYLNIMNMTRQPPFPDEEGYDKNDAMGEI